MKELSEDELLEWLGETVDRYAYLQISHPHLAYKLTGRDRQAYFQVVAKIKKPKVTEGWIEEKARKIKEIIADLFNANYSLEKCKDLIRVFTEEMRWQ